ncbi:hypothetical protein [Salinigranum salinum]|jgi:hypothetical protein|uniref:hypothetical protein n=1 Tax=Salinigranum salinum TaxID=1364937 RepID=UPI0012611AD4|nr:hypothetical protein [Salinigranum salinum]
MRYKAHFRQLTNRPGFTTLLITVLVAVMLFTGPVAAQTAPTGGGGGGTADYMTILTDLYQVIYDTLQYVGLATLVFGAIVWFTARKNSQRSETGMKLLIGGAAMTVFYFGLGAFVALLEWIATP